MSAAVVVAVAFVAGCSDGASTPLPIHNDGGAQPLAKAHATVRIAVPRRSHRIGRRGSRYVSPNTESLVVTMTALSGKVSKFSANLLPSNPNCSTTPSNLLCTLPITVGPGTYSTGVATYDAPLSASGGPAGNELSSTQGITLYVWANQNNKLDVTLEGIAKTIDVVPNAASTLTGDAATGYTLAKCAGPQVVSVFGVDADGNIILGAGSPTPHLVSNNTYRLPVATPAPSSPNAFTLNPIVDSTATSVTLTATVAPGAQSGASPVHMPVSVSLPGGSSVCGIFKEFALTNESPRGIVAPTNAPLWFTEDDLNFDTGTLGEIPLNAADSGDIGQIPLALPSSGPELTRLTSIAAGPDSAVWFTDCGATQIDRAPLNATSASQITSFTVPTTRSGPTGIVTGPDGALWFTEEYGNKIGRLTTSGAFTEYAVPTANSQPIGIAAGPDGALWFTENCGENIGRVTTAGQFSEYSLPALSARPYAIAAGSDGALWFTECGAGNIGRITTSGQVTEFGIPSPYSEPYGIAAGPDGALWFTEKEGNNIGRIPTAATSGTQITEFAVPTTSSGLEGIAAASDGSLWFTESFTYKIGRIQ